MKLLILILSFILGILSTKIVNHKLDSILIRSIIDGDIEGVKELFSGHIIPDIETKDKDHSNTPLITAAMYDNAYIAKMLIDNGANINAKNGGGWTPLITAAAYDRVDIAQLLIDNGADVNAKSNSGLTPLMTASTRNNRIDTVKMLIDAGADIDTKDNDGDTARDYIKDKDEFDNFVRERKEHLAKVRSIIQEQDQLIPDLGNIIIDYI
jgi:ankyrin repeat protein